MTSKTVAFLPGLYLKHSALPWLADLPSASGDSHGYPVDLQVLTVIVPYKPETQDRSMGAW